MLERPALPPLLCNGCYQVLDQHYFSPDQQWNPDRTRQCMLCEQGDTSGSEITPAIIDPPKIAVKVEQCPVVKPTILFILAQLDLDELVKDIQLKLCKSYVPQEHIERIDQCVKELEGIAHKIGPEWHAQPFGSTINGFGTRDSDVDVCCFIDGAQDQDSRLAAQDLQHKLQPLIEQHQSFEVLSVISRAKIPILKLRFQSQLEVDLSCHNTEPMPNTLLLKKYSELNPVVSQLGILVKTWAKQESVCGAPSRFLSSYSLILMTIYFLQATMNLPCINPATFQRDQATDPIVAKKQVHEESTCSDAGAC